jgi:hypothetical protein
MKLSEKQTFCRICINRKYELQKGSYCGLTNELPEFEISCSQFEENQTERIEWERQLMNQVKDDYNYTVADSETVISRLSSELPESFSASRSKWDSLAMIASPFILILVGIYAYLTGDDSVTKIFDNPLIAAYIGLPTIGLFVYGIFHLRKTDPKLTFDNTGITIHEKEIQIPWQLILRSAFKHVGSGQNGRFFLSFICLGTFDEINYQITSLNLSKKKLLNTIEVFRRRAKNLL